MILIFVFCWTSELFDWYTVIIYRRKQKANKNFSLYFQDILACLIWGKEPLRQNLTIVFILSEYYFANPTKSIPHFKKQK